jgi:signal transduction histidine kinase
LKTAPHVAALIGPETRPLRTLLPELLPAVEIEARDELYDAIPGLIESPPTSLWLDAGPLSREDLGTLRVLRQVLRGARIVLVFAAERGSSSLLDSAAALGVGVLRAPIQTRKVLPLLESAAEGKPPEAIRELVSGLADQLNNPLAALAGRLQLMKLLLPDNCDPDLRDNLGFATESAERLKRSLAKLTMLAGKRRPHLQSWPLSSFAQELRTSLPRVALRQPTIESDIQGDGELLRFALACVAQVSLDLVGSESSITLEIQRQRFLFHFDEPMPLPCRAEELFAPYRLLSLLREPDLGLDLSVARALFEAQDAGLLPILNGGALAGFVVEFDGSNPGV